MFANPIWSILLLAAPIAIYWFIIRPRLKVRFTDLYSRMDSLWARVWARIYAFRTFWIGVVGAVVTALPDILVQIAPLDFSGILPQPWPAYTGPATSIAIVLMKAFETKPGEVKS
jgi:hypothetical protein